MTMARYSVRLASVVIIRTKTWRSFGCPLARRSKFAFPVVYFVNLRWAGTSGRFVLKASHRKEDRYCTEPWFVKWGSAIGLEGCCTGSIFFVNFNQRSETFAQTGQLGRGTPPLPASPCQSHLQSGIVIITQTHSLAFLYKTLDLYKHTS